MGKASAHVGRLGTALREETHPMNDRGRLSPTLLVSCLALAACGGSHASTNGSTTTGTGDDAGAAATGPSDAGSPTPTGDAATPVTEDAGSFVLDDSGLPSDGGAPDVRAWR